jgi:hypothetical protein
MREVNARNVSVMLVNGTLIKGKTNMGNARRLSDFINRADGHFMVFFDVSLEGQEHDVVFINRDHIVWIKPDEEKLQDGGEGELTLKIESEAS